MRTIQCYMQCYINVHYARPYRLEAVVVSPSNIGTLSQDHFYVRERFHILHMSMTSRSKVTCVLTTKDGEVDVEFSLPPGTSSHLRYKHMLYRSLTQSEQVGTQPPAVQTPAVPLPHPVRTGRYIPTCGTNTCCTAPSPSQNR